MAFKRIWHQAQILAALDAGATVVASGERLARTIRLAHGEARHVAGTAVWERPAVLSYGAFLDSLYDAAVDAALSAPNRSLPKRVSETAAECRWEEAIRTSAEGVQLLQPAAAAREAARAWTLLQAHRIPLDGVAAGDEDARAFAGWAQSFVAASRAQGWLEEARLVDWLATQLRHGGVPPPARVLFAGFDALAPQQRELIESLRAAGSDVQVPESEAAPAQARRHAEADAAAEMRAAAAWARIHLERDPTASIGIVVRDLASCRAAIMRALDDALCPAAAAGRPVHRAYNLSLGLPLGSFPAVHAALAVLELVARPPRFETVSFALRSPFLGGAEQELAARARLELKLRERVSEHISLQALSRFAAGQGDVPRFVQIVGTLRELDAGLPARQKPSDWARVFTDALTRAGWPGDRSPDSDEYQAVMAFRAEVTTLVHLDGVLGAVPMGDVLLRLRRLCMEEIFQPAGAHAPVQVLGLLETAGLAFDHLWIMGLTDETWPAGPRPAAFIPPRLQRQFGVPHAGAALELEFARRLTARLLASAPEVVVSVAAREGDAPLRPSPLVATLPDAAAPECAPARAYRLQLQAEYDQAIERHRDLRAPMLKPGDVTEGGTGVIRSQASCPFQAFATHRLGAEPLAQPALGPDALERGSLVHQVLQAVWTELKDHAGLIALDTAGRRALAERCAAAVVARRARDMPEVFTPRVAALERDRLAGRVTAWLAHEAARPPFRVMEVEAQRALRLGGLTLDMRVDRIDELPDGTRLVIDYKTGAVDVESWLEERPGEPQLPLYAVANPTRLGGVIFASLKPGAMRFSGLADRSGLAAGVVNYIERRRRPVPDWPALLAYWEANLTALAEEYAQGDARVSPKGAEDCRRCHLSTVCRIHELGPGSGVDDDA